MKKFSRDAFADSGMIHSDGYRSYIPALESFTRKHRSYDPDSSLLHWRHLVISNAKAFIMGTYHGLPKKPFQSYLDGYFFRFSRRGFDGALAEYLTLSIALSRLVEQEGEPQLQIDEAGPVPIHRPGLQCEFI